MHISGDGLFTHKCNAFLEDELKQEKIESELSKIIPVYMIPNMINILKSLPFNKNGKN